MNGIHISDDDLERYYLSMVTTEEEVAPLEEHMLACPSLLVSSEGLKSGWTPNPLLHREEERRLNPMLGSSGRAQIEP